MNAHMRASRSCRVKTSPFVGIPVLCRFSSSFRCLSRSAAWARCSNWIASWKLREPTLLLPLRGSGFYLGYVSMNEIFVVEQHTYFDSTLCFALIALDMGCSGSSTFMSSSSPSRVFLNRVCMFSIPSSSSSRASITACSADIR